MGDFTIQERLCAHMVSLPVQPSDVRACCEVLASIGACVRCALRCLHVCDAGLLAERPSVLSAGLRVALARYWQDRSEESTAQCFFATTDEGCGVTCGLCAGLLERRLVSEAAVEAVRASATFREDTIALHMGIPHGIALRASLFDKAVAARGGSTFFSLHGDVLEMRDVWRAVVAARLRQEFGLLVKREADLSLTIDAVHEELEMEVAALSLKRQKVGRGERKKRRTNAVSNATMTGALRDLTLDTARELALWPVRPLDPVAKIRAEASRAPIFVAGRYCKENRSLSQTEWAILSEEGETPTSSVEEAIREHLIALFEADRCVFHGGGREDRDVRMLGTGRPFIMEVVNPRRSDVSQAELEVVTHSIGEDSNGVVLQRMHVVPQQAFEDLQAAEGSKTKHYRCVVWSSARITEEAVAKLNAVKNLLVKQKTPVRVLGRRAPMTRPKLIYAMNVPEVLNEHYFILDIHAEAGTYIKEFVHSDFGRTDPSVASLLGREADILQLDVTEVDCASEFF